MTILKNRLTTRVTASLIALAAVTGFALLGTSPHQLPPRPSGRPRSFSSTAPSPTLRLEPHHQATAAARLPHRRCRQPATQRQGRRRLARRPHRQHRRPGRARRTLLRRSSHDQRQGHQHQGEVPGLHRRLRPRRRRSRRRPRQQVPRQHPRSNPDPGPAARRHQRPLHQAVALPQPVRSRRLRTRSSAHGRNPAPHPRRRPERGIRRPRLGTHPVLVPARRGRQEHPPPSTAVHGRPRQLPRNHHHRGSLTRCARLTPNQTTALIIRAARS
jgi:hypothetical protein